MMSVLTTVIPAERSESRDPTLSARKIESWVPDRPCGPAGMTGLVSTIVVAHHSGRANFRLLLFCRLTSVHRGPDVPQAQARAHAQHLRLCIRTAGEAHRLSRIRCALAAGQRDQPDGSAGAWPWPRHADPRT